MIAVHFITPELLKKGIWKVIGHADTRTGIERIELEQLRARGFVGAKIVGSGIIQKLLEAYHGLRAWDGFHDPEYLDKLLLPSVKRPPGTILEKKSR